MLPRPRPGVRVEAGIWPLVQWAFQRECARLEFDEIDRITGARPGFGTEFVMIERARLGCKVDGGGRSEPHPDADVVAAAVAALPVVHGGRSMAVHIAEAARAGMMPDAMVGAVPRAWPAGKRDHGPGRPSKVADAADLGSLGWPHQRRVNRRGVRVVEPVQFCPVVWSPTSSQIGAARRGYLAFWGALAEVRDNLRIGRGLSCFDVTLAMPPKMPWK
ncbi:hypothetical protein [Maritimibacter sp. DP1N21-5]|uniref:hypothetical protein n=1 Tax=Maritimibacter sp. DP1N21-5 TaxID=2836867 RepID=UPI001C478983|nr:hypothetical protein [Maritimibacter sp. DP1N21-5]MBV7408192.1 hypothetical protein [Maritimibacter sp. DP1N21-5]